jgi:hypothetical protein
VGLVMSMTFRHCLAPISDTSLMMDVIVHGGGLSGHGHRSHDDIKAMLVTCYLICDYSMDYFVHDSRIRVFILGHLQQRLDPRG